MRAVRDPSRRRSDLCSTEGGANVFGRDAKNKTTHTQRSTMSLYRNSPARFHAIGSVEMLHLTTPGVVKKNDHVMRNVPVPINALSADRIWDERSRGEQYGRRELDNAEKISFAPDAEYGQATKQDGLFEIYTAMPLSGLRREFLDAERNKDQHHHPSKNGKRPI